MGIIGTKIKNRIAKEIWESDIHNNFDQVKNKINEFHGKNI